MPHALPHIIIKFNLFLQLSCHLLYTESVILYALRCFKIKILHSMNYCLNYVFRSTCAYPHLYLHMQSFAWHWLFEIQTLDSARYKCGHNNSATNGGEVCSRPLVWGGPQISSQSGSSFTYHMGSFCFNVDFKSACFLLHFMLPIEHADFVSGLAGSLAAQRLNFISCPQFKMSAPPPPTHIHTQSSPTFCICPVLSSGWKSLHFIISHSVLIILH